MTLGWIFVVLIYVHPQALPEVMIYGPYATPARCEQARSKYENKNTANVYVHGVCEELRVRQ